MLLLQYTLIYTSVLTLVALGGMWAERSGVINLGLEGSMTVGCLGACIVMTSLPTTTNGFLVVFLTFLSAILCGLIYSLLLAVASIIFKADQTITGTALNILATALAVVVTKAITLKRTGKAAITWDYTVFSKYFNFSIGSLKVNWVFVLLIIVLIISILMLYKTKFGLNLMACGENPQAADSNGINVYKMRFTGVLMSGGLAGIGGLAYILAGSSWNVEGGVDGFGFLALALMIFGQWKPFLIFLGAILFGFLRAFAAVGGFSGIKIDSTVYLMLPYLVCLLVLCFTSKNSKAPKAEGIPYDKGLR